MAAVGEVPVRAPRAVIAGEHLVEQEPLRAESAGELLEPGRVGRLVARRLGRLDLRIPPVAEPHVGEREQQRQAERGSLAVPGGERRAGDRAPVADRERLDDEPRAVHVAGQRGEIGLADHRRGAALQVVIDPLEVPLHEAAVADRKPQRADRDVHSLAVALDKLRAARHRLIHRHVDEVHGRERAVVVIRVDRNVVRTRRVADVALDSRILREQRGAQVRAHQVPRVVTLQRRQVDEADAAPREDRDHEQRNEEPSPRCRLQRSGACHALHVAS